MVRCAESHPPAPWELSTAAGSHWKLEQTSRRFTKGTPLGQEISKLDQKQLLWLRRISNLWKGCALKNMSNLLMPVVSIKDLYDLLCISDVPVRVYVLWVLFSFTLGFLACIEANRSWFTQSLSKNMADWGSSPLWLDGTHQVLIRNNYIECIN